MGQEAKASHWGIGSMNIFRGKLSSPSDDDLFPDLVPFEYSSRPYPESASYLSRDGNLLLCRNENLQKSKA